ncbi:MAG: histidine triad nucleotide-binding protein [Deltaproteobacteria bacterium]|nr:histidine triad nucleotide-binding protein [Deltaproteobacteria bacterium]
MNVDCLFCRIANKQIPSEIVFQDEEITAFKDVHPQAPVHLLIIPNRHIAYLADMEADDRELMGKLVLKANDLANEFNLAESGYRVVINNGSGAGQSVFHLHVHLLGGRGFTWPPG